MSRPEAGAETEIITAPVPVNDDKINALIAAAARLDELGMALDKFRAFTLKRALPGDFVAFKGEDGEEYLSLVGPAAERIAAAIGVSFVDWKDYKTQDKDAKGDLYIWWYECTTLWQGRRLERTTGRAGSRDRFFGMVRGEIKELSDVSEGDIRTAARRNCMKEGVALMLGLRRIPKKAAEAMGLDLTKVKTVDFGAKSSKGAEAAPSGTPITLVKYEVKEIPYKDKSKGTFSKWIFTDDKGAKYETIKEKVAHAAITFVEKKALCKVAYTKGQYGNDLTGIMAATASETPAAEGAQTEPADQGA